MKTENEKARPHAAWIIALVLALVAIALALFADAAAAVWIKKNSPLWLKRAATLTSRIGDWPAHVALGLLGLGFSYFARSKDWSRIFLAMLIACALAGVAARALKIGTGRARPFVEKEMIWSGPRLNARYNAFPSGHTASSAAFFFPLFLARKRFGGALLAVPVVIAAARVLCGAHYLSDVTFAFALGIACATSTSALLRLSAAAPRLSSRDEEDCFHH